MRTVTRQATYVFMRCNLQSSWNTGSHECGPTPSLCHVLHHCTTHAHTVCAYHVITLQQTDATTSCRLTRLTLDSNWIGLPCSAWRVFSSVGLDSQWCDDGFITLIFAQLSSYLEIMQGCEDLELDSKFEMHLCTHAGQDALAAMPRSSMAARRHGARRHVWRCFMKAQLPRCSCWL
jgi:hypothetical protein